MGFLDIFRRKEHTKEPKKEVGISPGGSLLYQHGLPKKTDSQYAPEPENIYAEKVIEHFQKLFPDHEHFNIQNLASNAEPMPVNANVHILGPTEKDPFYVLYTTGMSDLPMTLPKGIEEEEDLKYAELYLFLPRDWKFTEVELQIKTSDTGLWPVLLLKHLAGFPHEYQTWLGWGHTVPNGPHYTPLADNVGFGGVILARSSDIPPLKTDDQKKVNFYTVIPAYKEEIEYRLKYGMDALGQRFLEGRMPFVLDVRRPNLCADFTEVLDAF